MREVRFGGRMPLTYLLMIVNAVVFVVTAVLEFYRLFPVGDYLALSVSGLARGYVWQLLTYQFLHGGLLHLLLNLVAIYFFGRAIEEALGPRRMLVMYLVGGTVGGLMQILMAVAFPGLFGGSVVGASAGAFALVAAFATLFPNHLITLLLFFVIPVSLRARTLLWLSLALAVFGILVPSDRVADAAHLGGILTGMAWIRWQLYERAWRLPAPSLRRPRLKVVRLAPTRTRALEVDPLPPLDPEYVAREVDPILDKISQKGIQSLTEHERRVLEAARHRVIKR
jgi:membrane associated rhomboid family serine protease